MFSCKLMTDYKFGSKLMMKFNFIVKLSIDNLIGL